MAHLFTRASLSRDMVAPTWRVGRSKELELGDGPPLLPGMVGMLGTNCWLPGDSCAAGKGEDSEELTGADMELCPCRHFASYMHQAEL